MRSVADDLKRHPTPLVGPGAAEVERVLALGRRDVELYARARGVSIDEARRRFEQQRQVGRTPSACMDARRR